jgi:hypothetical protein
MAKRASFGNRWLSAGALVASIAGGVLLGSACGSEDDVFTGTGGDGGDSDGGGGTDGTVDGNVFVEPDGSGGGDGNSGGDGSGVNNCIPPTSIALDPTTFDQTVTLGGTFTKSYKAVATFASGTQDITTKSFFTVSDTQVGTMTGPNFNWGGAVAGTITVQALYCGVVGTSTLNLRVEKTFASTPGASTLPVLFSGAGTSTNTACKPTLKYPPDQVLLPPNTNVIEVHFLGGGNDKFEVSFTNAVTDVRIYTTCNGTTVADGMAAPGVTGGCLFELTQTEWDYIAKTNRNGAPLTVGVRGLGCDGTNAAASDSRTISFAKQDVLGTIYYWASIRLAGNVNSGGVYRYDYGRRGQTAEAVLTPVADANGNGGNSNGLCVGCHLVDREGRKMVFDFDDNDSDDEYGDMATDLYDIPSKTAAAVIKKGNGNAFSAGYASWNRSASKFLKDDGYGNGRASANGVTAFDGPRGTFHVISNTAAPSGKTAPTFGGTAALRGVTPDISPDDTKVVFAAAPDVVDQDPTHAGFFGASAHANVAPDGYTDEYFSGAGLFIAPWDSATGTVGAATAILPPAVAGAVNAPNYYYPSFSPDGSLIAFNYAASGANFHNPKARVQLVTAGGTVAADQVRVNSTNPVENGGDITNSWARWAPFVQDYKGKRIAWITFSSTRSYGLRIDNGGKVDCHPKESPTTVPGGSVPYYPLFTDPANDCTRAQLWMAAIDLDTGKVATGGDVSHPAFWLPFQDITTNNHLGQWTQKSFSGTCNTTNPCPTGFVCDNGGCAAIPPVSTPPPPQAQCADNSNCATGQCCSAGVCGATCGGGTPPAGCNTCLDCAGQACNGGSCGGCGSSADCCAPLRCLNNKCVTPIF